MDKDFLKVVGDKEIYLVKGRRGSKYCMAYFLDNEEWVTWGCNDDVTQFFHGHYFDNREDAENDFELRGK